MLNLLINLNLDFDSIIVIVSAITSVGLTLSVYNSYTEKYYMDRVKQAEAARAQEGLPSEVTLTPEDFEKNPELREIFGVTDADSNLNLALETIEHIDYQDNQDAAEDVNDYLDLGGDFLSAVFNYAFDWYNYYFIYINEFINYFLN
jgi:hypothetical protein